MRQFSRLLLTGVFLLAAAACTSDAPQRAVRAAPERKVLVLAPPSTSTGVELLLAALNAGGQGSPPLPPMATDVRKVSSANEAFAVVQELRPQLQRYSAIYTPSITLARAAQLAAPELPIVFEGVDDPLRVCLVDSRLRPGRNATGYMHLLPDSEAKMMELLRDGFPALREVLFVVASDNIPVTSCDPKDPYWTTPPPAECEAGEHGVDAYVSRRVNARALADRAGAMGLRMRFVVVCSAADFALLARMGPANADAGWVVPWQTLFDGNRQALVSALNASGLPGIYPNTGFAQVGGLMSLAAILDTGPDRASVLAMLRVLGGASPAELPVQEPRGFMFTVNAGTAERLKVRPSLMVMRRADQVVR